ncbi:serine--tRNA ligase [Candidatus Nomurabacteria bacterium]|nr:serine--tRNA ligase [Candidatus Nomurabacteria bacterium]
MIDIQFIRDNAEAVKQAAKHKNIAIDIDKLLELDHKRRESLQDIEKLRKARNETAAQMKNGQPSPELIAEGKRIKESLSELEAALEPTEHEYQSILRRVPNVPLDFVPVGSSEDDNVVQKTVGEVPKFEFKPKSDAELGQLNDSIDKERAAKVAGARFAYIKGELVQMQFAIIQFVLQTLSDEKIIQKIIDDQGLNLKAKPFVPVLPPAMVKTEPYEASGRLDAEEVTYKLSQDELWMNASAEHSMCTMYMNETLDESQLPIRYIAYATSFRREAGSYGKDTEGIFRMHQFDKIEMEVFSTSDTGLEEHKLLVAIQEYLVQQLELPYQLIQKCTADIGKPNAQGVDINTWMPAQGEYRETHTADYMTDYQARSLKTKVKRSNGELEFVHTNDATAFALGRILKAIAENYQQEDGSILVPKVLRPFMGGKEKI